MTLLAVAKKHARTVLLVNILLRDLHHARTAQTLQHMVRIQVIVMAEQVEERISVHSHQFHVLQIMLGIMIQVGLALAVI